MDGIRLDPETSCEADLSKERMRGEVLEIGAGSTNRARSFPFRLDDELVDRSRDVDEVDGRAIKASRGVGA